MLPFNARKNIQGFTLIESVIVVAIAVEVKGEINAGAVEMKGEIKSLDAKVNGIGKRLDTQ